MTFRVVDDEERRVVAASPSSLSPRIGPFNTTASAHASVESLASIKSTDDDGNNKIDPQADRTAVKRQWVLNGFLILAWYTASTTISIYNKWLFGHFPFSIFATSVHMSIQFMLTFGTITTLMMSRRELSRFVASIPLKSAGRVIIPCALATSLDVGLSCKSLEFVTLSFYTMVKSSVPVWVVTFAVIFGLEKLTCKLSTIIGIISLGVLLTVAKDPTQEDGPPFRLGGFLMVLIGSIMSGLRWSLTRFLMEHEQFRSHNALFTNLVLTPFMFIFLLSISASVEGMGLMLSSSFFSSFGSALKTMAMLSLGGFLAFSMTTAEFFLLQRTSVMTLPIAGIFKELLTILLSIIIFGDSLQPLNVMGLIVSLGGIAWYNYWRWQTGVRQEQSRRMSSAHIPHDLDERSSGGSVMPEGNTLYDASMYTQLDNGSTVNAAPFMRDRSI